MDDPSCALTFLGRPLPDGFERRVLVLAAGEELPYVEADWRDSLVVVEVGRIELECAAGGTRSFDEGASMWLAGIDLRMVRNRGPQTAVLSAISRRR